MKIKLGHLKYANVPLYFDLQKPKFLDRILFVGGYYRAMDFYRFIIESIPPDAIELYLSVMHKQREKDWDWVRNHPSFLSSIETQQDVNRYLPSIMDEVGLGSEEERAYVEENELGRLTVYIGDDLLAMYRNKLMNVHLPTFASLPNTLFFTAVDPFEIQRRYFTGWGYPTWDWADHHFSRFSFTLWLFAPFEETNVHYQAISFGAIRPSLLRDNELLVWLNHTWDVLVRD